MSKQHRQGVGCLYALPCFWFREHWMRTHLGPTRYKILGKASRWCEWQYLQVGFVNHGRDWIGWTWFWMGSSKTHELMASKHPKTKIVSLPTYGKLGRLLFGSEIFKSFWIIHRIAIGKACIKGSHVLIATIAGMKAVASLVLWSSQATKCRNTFVLYKRPSF